MIIIMEVWLGRGAGDIIIGILAGIGAGHIIGAGADGIIITIIMDQCMRTVFMADMAEVMFMQAETSLNHAVTPVQVVA